MSEVGAVAVPAAVDLSSGIGSSAVGSVLGNAIDVAGSGGIGASAVGSAMGNAGLDVASVMGPESIMAGGPGVTPFSISPYLGPAMQGLNSAANVIQATRNRSSGGPGAQPQQMAPMALSPPQIQTVTPLVISKGAQAK